MSDEKLDPQTEGPTKSAEIETKRQVSERKLQANRQNAKKSTGPRSERGKRQSAFNAVKHGLLSKKALLSANGKLVDEDVQCLFDSLREEYGCGDLASELLAESAAIAYLRIIRGLEYEAKYLTPHQGEFHSVGAMPTLLRYQTANQRVLDNSLQMLMQMRATFEARNEAVGDDWDLPETGPTVTCETGTPSSPGGNFPRVPSDIVRAVGDGSEDEDAAPAGRGGEARALRAAAAVNIPQGRKEAG